MNTILAGQPNKLRKMIIRAFEGPIICLLLFFIASLLPNQGDWHDVQGSLHALLFVGGSIFLAIWLFSLRCPDDTVGKNRFFVNGSFLFAVASLLLFFSPDWQLLWCFCYLLLFCSYLLCSFFLLSTFQGESKKIWRKSTGVKETACTDQKDLEYQLQLDQKILENTGEAIVITDADASIIDINRAYTQITGYEIREIIGENPGICKSGHHDTAFYEYMWKCLNETGKWSGEIWDRRKNGEVYPKWLTINAVYDSAGDVINYVGIFTDITEKRKVEKQLKNLLFYDPLTHLPNRTLFEKLLAQALLDSQFYDESLALLCIDLKKFKDINDTLGYKAGDDLLIQVSKRIRTGVRETDTVSRLCGDQFIVLFSKIKLQESLVHLARHLLHVLHQPFYIGGEEAFVDAYIGISMYPEDGQDVESLIKYADTAMNFARKKGQGNYQYFQAQMNENLVQRVTIERELRYALEHDEFILYYQPKYVLATGEMSGVEALMRWRHPKKGLISPAEFIPVAEESNLIIALGAWGLMEACRQVKAWQDQGLGTLPMAVNLSSKQFQDKGLLHLATESIKDNGIEPEGLEIEITESIIMENPDDAALLLEDIRKLGVQIAVDDFGTGYSSLAYIKKFPVNTLKIDLVFITDIVRDAHDEAIVASILAMAKSLNLKVVAEGVETKGQLDLLREMGCEEVQGYYFSKPLPPEGIVDLLKKKPLKRRAEYIHD